MSKSFQGKLLLFCIFFIALFLRLYGNNWDQGWHLHPDERFLTMVQTNVKIPASVSEYLNQRTSSFNPVNKGHGFFVYGTLPLLINKVIAQFFYNDTYDLSHLQGRVLSGIADFFVVLLIFKLVELIEKKLQFSRNIKYLAAFFYTIAVLPIQLSHFYTVDTFLNLFCWISLYFAIKFMLTESHSGKRSAPAYRKAGPESDSGVVLRLSNWLPRMTYLYFSGLFLGLALASKMSALLFAPLVGVFILIGLLSVIPAKAGIRSRMSWIPVSAGMTLFIISCYLALRLGSPYYFETDNIINPQISTVFINNIKTLKSFDNPQMLFPPANQWVNAPLYLSPLNVIVFGVGPVYFLLSVVGYVLLFKKNKIVYIALIWFISFFIYQSLQFAKTMRYLIFIYPFLAIFAAIGSEYVFTTIRHLTFSIRLFIYLLIGLGIVYWPLAFMSIYTKNHSRVAASKWIYNTIPSSSTLTYEYWDDPLPLAVQDPASRGYKIEEIHIFDPDTTEKWNKINAQLNRADYYIMSSNRGWGSIPKTPQRYPQASAFYTNLFAGRAGFTKVAEFYSYPSLRYLGIPIDFPDQWAEEAFTVYDHPQVIIFKKNDK